MYETAPRTLKDPGVVDDQITPMYVTDRSEGTEYRDEGDTTKEVEGLFDGLEFRNRVPDEDTPGFFLIHLVH